MTERATTDGGLLKITIQVTPAQLQELDSRTGPHGSRSDLVRRYVDQGLERDRRVERAAEAAGVS